MEANVDDDIREVGLRIWGYTDIRPEQMNVMTTIKLGKDVMASLPTGYGKSFIFQGLGVMEKGITVVICPLVALMHDQVTKLNYLGVSYYILCHISSVVLRKYRNLPVFRKFAIFRKVPIFTKVDIFRKVAIFCISQPCQKSTITRRRCWMSPMERGGEEVVFE